MATVQIGDIFPIRFTQRGEPEPVVFDGPVEMRHWGKREAGRWTGVFESVSPFEPYSTHARTRLVTCANEIVSLAERIEFNATGLDAPLLDELQIAIDRYETGTNIAFHSRLGRFIEKLFEGGKTATAIGLIYLWTRMVVEPQHFPPDQAEDKATNVMLINGHTALSDFNVGSQAVDLDKRLQTLNSDTEQLRARLDATAADHETKEAVTYWQEKADSHGSAMKWTGVLAALSAAFAVFAIIKWEAPFVTTYIRTDAVAGDQKSSMMTSLNWGVITISITISVLFIWYMRTVLRLFYASRQLREDARERVVMMKALLSLSENPRVSDTMKGVLWPKAFDILFKPMETHSITDGGPWEAMKPFTTAIEKFKPSGSARPD